MSSLVKMGTWGGDGGYAHDITVAPRRLETITIRSRDVVHSLSFSYRDQDKGSSGGREEIITLAASEYLMEVAGSVGWAGNDTPVITSLKFITNRGTYGPFGKGEGTDFNVPVLNNGSIVGMFGRAGGYLDALGFYILPY